MHPEPQKTAHLPLSLVHEQRGSERSALEPDAYAGQWAFTTPRYWTLAATAHYLISKRFSVSQPGKLILRTRHFLDHGRTQA
jgi:hypothetical protein